MLSWPTPYVTEKTKKHREHPDFWSHSEKCGQSSNQEEWPGPFDEALEQPLRLEGYREVRFLPGGRTVTSLRWKRVDSP